ncbi:MAG: hypothetical protein COB59_07550 [Rhodospirillaceae bacterium]|nr:MAG: hypothetical protein COB59_07550 [Rhodospirillaceae bacterium]
MKQFTCKKYRNLFNIIAACGLLASLSGCIVAVPPAIQLVSFALDGVSYVTTGKSVTDHAISTITAKDCAMSRILDGGDICSEIPVEIALLPDGTPAPHAGEAARAMLASADDAAFQKSFQALSETDVENIDQFDGETFDTAAAQNSLL